MLFLLGLVADFCLGCVLDVVLKPLATAITKFTVGLIYQRVLCDKRKEINMALYPFKEQKPKKKQKKKGANKKKSPKISSKERLTPGSNTGKPQK